MRPATNRSPSPSHAIHPENGAGPVRFSRNAVIKLPHQHLDRRSDSHPGLFAIEFTEA
jgi:hypothetical protein